CLAGVAVVGPPYLRELVSVRRRTDVRVPARPTALLLPVGEPPADDRGHFFRRRLAVKRARAGELVDGVRPSFALSVGGGSVELVGDVGRYCVRYLNCPSRSRLLLLFFYWTIGRRRIRFRGVREKISGRWRHCRRGVKAQDVPIALDAAVARVLGNDLEEAVILQPPPAALHRLVTEPRGGFDFPAEHDSRP